MFDYTYQFAGLLSRDGVLLESNRTALKAAGVTLNEAVGKLFWETPFWTQQPAAEIARLRAGIERAGRGEFVRFQYQIEQTRGSVRKLEALARWQHPTMGPVSPQQFINLAEESGDMPRLGQWILRRACCEARQLVGRYCARVAVNVSMQQLLHDNFLAQLDDILRDSQLRPQELELELTESVFNFWHQPAVEQAAADDPAQTELGHSPGARIPAGL